MGPPSQTRSPPGLPLPPRPPGLLCPSGSRQRGGPAGPGHPYKRPAGGGIAAGGPVESRKAASGPVVPAGAGHAGTVKRGCAAANIQQADAVPRREAEEAAIAAGVAAAAAVPVGRGGQHPHRRHRPRSLRAAPRSPPRALPPSAAHAVASRRKPSQTMHATARAPRAPAVKRGGEDGGAVGD